MDYLSPPGWELGVFLGSCAVFTVVNEIMKRVMAKLLAKF